MHLLCFLIKQHSETLTEGIYLPIKTFIGFTAHAALFIHLLWLLNFYFQDCIDLFLCLYSIGGFGSHVSLSDCMYF